MIFITILSAIASATFILKSVPIPKVSFEPPPTVYAKFAAETNENMLVAKMKLTTSVPTIKLDSYDNILQSISCENSILNIGFMREIDAQDAMRLWSNFTTLAFIIDETHGCNGAEIATVLATGFTIAEDSLILQASYTVVGIEDVVEDWSAVITEEPIIAAKNVALLKQKIINLNFNLSHHFMAMGQPGFTLFGNELIHFQNCYTNGSIKFVLELHGHRKSLLSYRVAMEGEFNANAEVKFGVLSDQEVTLFRTNVLSIPLSPWSIPGVLVVGPSFGVEIGLYGFSNTELSVELGFDYHLPIQFEMASKDLKSDPTHSTRGKAKFNPHPPKYVIGYPPPTAIGGFINLAPTITFGVSIFSASVFEISGSFNNELGVIHRFNNGTSCPELKTSVELFFREVVGAALTLWPAEWDWTFFDSGRKLLYISCKEDIGRFNETAGIRVPNP